MLSLWKEDAPFLVLPLAQALEPSRTVSALHSSPHLEVHITLTNIQSILSQINSWPQTTEHEKLHKDKHHKMFGYSHYPGVKEMVMTNQTLHPVFASNFLFYRLLVPPYADTVLVLGSALEPEDAE